MGGYQERVVVGAVAVGEGGVVGEGRAEEGLEGDDDEEEQRGDGEGVGRRHLRDHTPVVVVMAPPLEPHVSLPYLPPFERSPVLLSLSIQI